MSIEFPFTPKSNSKLMPGHFWPIRLSNVSFACGIVLATPTDTKIYRSRGFYAGLLNWNALDRPTVSALELSPLKILKEGKVHIKTITTQEESILGFIDPEKNNLPIKLTVDSRIYSPSSQVVQAFDIVRKATPEDHQNLDTISTWGYSVIINLANSLLLQ